MIFAGHFFQSSEQVIPSIPKQIEADFFDLRNGKSLAMLNKLFAVFRNNLIRTACSLSGTNSEKIICILLQVNLNKC